ncbi:MAG: chorismate synthase [bacterium]|nr:chorismate synthase [bacterium]
MKIVLSGPKCSGKSITGSKLSKTLGLPFIESDELIEELFYNKTNNRLTCRSICSEFGEDTFREYERKAIEEISKKDWCIISTGGSTLLNKTSRQLLRDRSILILLTATSKKLLKRFNQKSIPAYLNDNTAQELFLSRCSLITEVIKPFADIIVDTSNINIDEVVNTIYKELKIEISLLSQKPNTFGNIVRMTTFGESHGPAVGAILEGIQPGVEICEHDIQKELNRRRPGQSAVSTPRDEKDQVKILSGVFEGKTTGTSIGMLIENKDQDSTKYDLIKNSFRPGTADFTFWKKYGIRDHKGGGRSSGRETAGRVMCGAIAKKILKTQEINIVAHTVSIAGIESDTVDYSIIENNSVRCADSAKAIEMENAILEAKDNNDSVGGIAQIEISGLPAGLGDPVFGKLDAKLAMAIVSLGAVKGIEFGSGFSSAGKRGSENNDAMRNGKFITNNAGGILGGISTGEKIIIKVAVKPTSSIFTKQQTCDLDGNNIDIQVEGRHDPCIVPRIIPVLETMSAMVILDTLEIQGRINPEFNK